MEDEENYPNSGAQTRYCQEDEGDGLKMPPKARVTVLALIGAALAFHFMPLLVPKRGLPTRDTDSGRKDD